MLERYKRWRHTRGFGIHSPFAYRVVCDIISQPYHFYDYDMIDAELESVRRSRKLRNLCRLLLRLSNFLRPKVVCVSPSTPGAVLKSLRLGYGKSILKSDNTIPEDADLYLDHKGAWGVKDIAPLFHNDGATIFILNIEAEVREYILGNLPGGVAFYSPSHLLLFLRKEITPVTYSINLF